MAQYFVLRNEAQNHTRILRAADATTDDYKANDGLEMTVVKTIDARTLEIAMAVFEEWSEREQQDRVHDDGCDQGDCWCQQ